MDAKRTMRVAGMTERELEAARREREEELWREELIRREIRERSLDLMNPVLLDRVEERNGRPRRNG